MTGITTALFLRYGEPVLLSDRDIRAELDAGRVALDPCAPAFVQPSAATMGSISSRKGFSHSGLEARSYNVCVMLYEDRKGGFAVVQGERTLDDV